MTNTPVLLLILLYFLNSLTIQAQFASISGKVRDKKTGESLIGTNILLYSDTTQANKKLIKGTATNSYGYYSIINVPKGKYYLVFKNIGYDDSTEVIEVISSNYSIELNIEMSERSIQMDAVIIQAIKNVSEEVGKIDISPQLLAKLPTLSGESDVFKTLQLLPGVKVASEISSGLYVRGGSPDHNLTIIDEVPLYNPAHLGNFASTFNSYAIQNIELYKGVYPAKYGGRIGSILDIKLRSGTREREMGRIGIGLINTHFAFEGPLGVKSTYLLSGRLMYLDQIQKKLNTKSSTPRYNFSDLNIKTSYELANEDIITISSIYSSDKLYSSPQNTEIDYNINWSNFTLSLNWLQNGKGSIFSKTVFSLVKYNFNSKLLDKFSVNPFSDYYTVSDITDFNIMRSIETTIFSDQKLYSGVGISFHNYDIIYSNIYEEKLNIGDNISNVEGIGYIQHEAKLWNLLDINYGMRFNYFSDNKFISFEPRLTVSYPFSDSFFLKFGFTKNSQFVHLITRNDISLPTDIWYPSTDNIKPSQSFQYLIGLDSYFNQFEYRLSIEAYYRRMKDIYEFKDATNFVIGDPIEKLFTSGEAEAYGVEVFFNKRMGLLTGWFGYTFSYTKRLFNELNSGKIYYPRFDRRHDISIVLSYELLRGLNFGATWTYASGQGITLPTGQYMFSDIGVSQQENVKFNYNKRNSYSLPSYHKLDLNINYKTSLFNSDVELYMNLFNVYNRKNPFAYYISFDENEEKSNPKLKQIVLFPFIPTIGIVLNF